MDGVYTNKQDNMIVKTIGLFYHHLNVIENIGHLVWSCNPVLEMWK